MNEHEFRAYLYHGLSILFIRPAMKHLKFISNFSQKKMFQKKKIKKTFTYVCKTWIRFFVHTLLLTKYLTLKFLIRFDRLCIWCAVDGFFQDELKSLSLIEHFTTTNVGIQTNLHDSINEESNYSDRIKWHYET